MNKQSKKNKQNKKQMNQTKKQNLLFTMTNFSELLMTNFSDFSRPCYAESERHF